MITKNMNGVIAVRLDKGEEILSSLTQVAEQYSVKSAKIDGIGTAKGTTVCLFDTTKKQFHETELPAFLEITNLCGSVTRQNGAPYLHLHITLADEAGHAFGGHLKRAVVGATAEVFLTVLDGEIGRTFDEETGLNLFCW